MATIGNSYPTLTDMAKRTNPNGAIDKVVESLSKKNPILDDIVWKEGNLTDGDRFTSRSALPSLTWRRYNQGITPSKSKTDQYDEKAGMLEGLSKVDDGLAELNGNKAAFRADEDSAFVQAYGLEVARAIFYESITTNPDRMHGLATRLNATSGNPFAEQIIKADPTASGADQTSIWMICWSPDTAYMFYPKGTKAGMQHTDMGLQLTEDADGKEFPAWVTHWKWRCGLAVKDGRYVVRIANIDTSAWKADLSAGADIPMAMVDAVAAVPELTTVEPVFYMNKKAFGMFNKQLMKSSNNFLEWVDRGGRRVATFLGVTIRIVDAITNSESPVV